MKYKAKDIQAVQFKADRKTKDEIDIILKQAGLKQSTLEFLDYEDDETYLTFENSDECCFKDDWFVFADGKFTTLMDEDFKKLYEEKYVFKSEVYPLNVTYSKDALILLEGMKVYYPEVNERGEINLDLNKDIKEYNDIRVGSVVRYKGCDNCMTVDTLFDNIQPYSIEILANLYFWDKNSVRQTRVYNVKDLEVVKY